MRTLAIAALAFTIAVLAGSAHGAVPPSLFTATQPSWSPDGSRIAFSGSVGGSGRSDVYTIARSGGVPANLTATDIQAGHEFPAWSPNGLLIASGDEVGVSQSVEDYSVTPARGGATEKVATSSAIGAISWSHDSRWLAIDGRESAEVARSDGSGQRTVASPACCGVWSTRALRLAVSVEHTTGYGGTDIYLVDSAGHKLRRLTRPPKHRVKGAPLAIDNTAIAWSRDGTRLLFSSTRTRRPGLYVMHADGTHQVRVATARTGDIAPRGTAVAYSGRGIWVAGANGKHAHRVSPSGTSPRWSPDGQWIAYVVKRASGASGIDLVRPDGTRRHALVGS